MNAAALTGDSSAPPALALRLFGTFTLVVRGQPAPPVSRSARALIALLALHSAGGRRSLERDFVAATLWPDSDDAAAHYNLRRTLTEVRGALGPEVHRLHAPRGAERTLRLDLTSVGAWCDLVAFDLACMNPSLERSGEEAVRTVVTLYPSGGALLEGERGDWLYPERETRKNWYLTAREWLAHRYGERGDRAEAIEHLRAVLALEPTRETAVRDLMTVLSESGQAATALATYQSLRVRLQRETDTAPDAQTTALYRQMLEKARKAHLNSERGVDTALPPTREEFASIAPLNNLPHPLTALVGRERDCVEVVACLRSDKDQPPVRLLTLLGAGGVGKTRLALAVAQSVALGYEDGVCFADLAPVDASTRIVSVVAGALRLTEPAQSDQPAGQGDPFRFLADALRSRCLLLVLDNCEHVTADAARLATALLRACPRLTILVTSRELLHVPGEIVWRVPGLTHEDAARLFLVRAAEADFRFRPQMAQQEAVHEIVTRLDGIPLAIEMAAARTRVLPIAEIAARLDDVFRLLSIPGGDLMPRHQTLRATLDWSYDLLSPNEKTLLVRLSVFAGGWTLAAAEAVCAGGGIAEADVFDLLASLIEKSLAQFQFDSGDSDDEPRYRMLETVRQYGAECLTITGEATPVQTRHVAYFVALAEEAAPHLAGPEKTRWLNRLEVEHDNLRVALDVCAALTTPSEALSGLRLSGALLRFWESRGYLTEARAHLARALAGRPAAEQAAEPSVLDAAAVKKAVTDALLAAGIAAKQQGDSPAARALLEESLALYGEMGNQRGTAETTTYLGNVTENQGDHLGAQLLYEKSLVYYREIGDKHGIGKVLMNLGNIALWKGDYSEALALYEQSLVHRRAVGEKSGISAVLNNMGLVALYQSDSAGARSLYEQSLVLLREIGDKQLIGNALNNMGLIAIYQDDYAGASSLYEECLALTREINDRPGMGRALLNLGIISERQADYSRARSFFGQSLLLCREVDNKQGVAQVLQNIAAICVHAEEGQPHGEMTRRAVVLSAASTALLTSLGLPLPPHEQATLDEWVDGVRTVLNDEVAFTTAWDTGAALTWEEAVEVALRED